MLKKLTAAALIAALLAPDAFALEAAAPLLPQPTIKAVQAVSIQPSVDIVPAAPVTAMGSVQLAAQVMTPQKADAAPEVSRTIFDGEQLKAKAPAVLGAFSAAAVALAPATAHAQTAQAQTAHAAMTLSQHMAEPSTWLILGGAMIGGGILGMVVDKVRDVARTLDDHPSDQEVARYQLSERVLRLGRARDAGFTGDRISMVGARHSYDLEIRELSGQDDANQALFEAATYSERFRFKYAAYRHPWIAGVLRRRRREADPEIRALRKRAAELRRFQAMAGVTFKDAPLPFDELERANRELERVEARLADLRSRY